jgi:hypothetical protein
MHFARAMPADQQGQEQEQDLNAIDGEAILSLSKLTHLSCIEVRTLMLQLRQLHLCEWVLIQLNNLMPIV